MLSIYKHIVYIFTGYEGSDLMDLNGPLALVNICVFGSNS